MLYLNKRSPSEELASVHNPNSPSGTSTWHQSLDDQKMTEVVAYPQPQHLYHFGGSSHRLLAPAPEQKSPYFSPDLYREMPVYPIGYQTTSHLARSPPEARSASVSSISSAASHGTPSMSSSRTMSPVTDSNSSDSMASPPVLTRTYNPPSSYHHTHQQHHHTSQALPSSLIPAPTHYLHAQVAPPPPMSLYPSMLVPSQRTTTYPSSSSYGYHQHMGHPYPSQQPMHNYHQLPMHNYQPVYTYNTSAQAYPSLSAGTILPSLPGSSVMTLPQVQRHEKAPIERLLNGSRIMRMIQSHLDYFDVTRAQMVNRFFKDHFDPSLCPEEDKIRCVMYAEINFKRFWPNNTSSGGRGGGDKDYGKHPGSFGCYHCFKVKNPENFELFRWKNDLEDAPDSNNNNNNNSNNNNNNDRNSQRGSVSSAASSRQPQQQQQISVTQPQNNPPLSPSTSSTSSHNTQYSLTTNSHYDPSVTRSSLAAAAAAASSSRQSGNGNNGTRRTASTGYSSSDQSPRIQETWGIRRFCIDCGIKKKFYRPGVLIELHKEKNAVWVCDCWVTHKRPQELDCKVCKKILPLSTPNRGRG